MHQQHVPYRLSLDDRWQCLSRSCCFLHLQFRTNAARYDFVYSTCTSRPATATSDNCIKKAQTCCNSCYNEANVGFPPFQPSPWTDAGDHDNCGDFVPGGGNQVTVQLLPVTIPCTDYNSDKLLDWFVCFAYNTVSSTTSSACKSLDQAVQLVGQSKCKCQTLSLNVTVVGKWAMIANGAKNCSS